MNEKEREPVRQDLWHSQMRGGLNDNVLDSERATDEGNMRPVREAQISLWPRVVPGL